VIAEVEGDHVVFHREEKQTKIKAK
jgi:hypothetical protein